MFDQSSVDAFVEDIRYTPEYKEMYERRKETIERVFADAKENMLCVILHTEAYPKSRIGLGLNLLQ